MLKPKKGIYLERDFRNILFSKAYDNAGGSLGSMASELGYNGKGRNGYVRNMWYGTTSISAPKFERLAKLARIPLPEVYSHIIDKEQNVLIKSWEESYQQYKNQQKRC